MEFSTQFISAGKEFSSFTKFIPAPYLRKSFILDFKPLKAELLICGLGFYEFYLNGERLTRSPLAPFISNPDDLLYYDRYDLTDRLTEGRNTFGFILGNGMQNSFGGQIWDFEEARWRSSPKLALSFAASDGKNEISFNADESFRCAASPIYMDDLRIGEFYDANREIEGWNLPSFDDSSWSRAVIAGAPSGECREGLHTPVAYIREIKPKRIFRGGISVPAEVSKVLPVPDTPEDEKCTTGYIYDFGENITGVCRLKIRGRKGQKIIMQFGSKLWNGGIDLKNMGFEPQGYSQRDIYICKGEDTEEWMPLFTFHGFQYCLVMGIDEAQATEDLLTYVVMHANLHKRAEFRCSDELVNKLQEATLRSDLSNLFYFPTDCPHREKNGWTGDAQLSAEQFLINLNTENTLKEWLFSIRKAQSEQGALPGIVPTGGWGFRWGNGPAWDAVLTELPYRIWQYRGDTEVLEQNAASILRYIAYLTTRTDEKGLIHIGLGDWCPVGNNMKSPLILTDSLISMDTASKAAEIFRVLKRDDWAVFAESFAEKLLAAIRKNLINKDLVAEGSCQTSQAAAIYYGVFTDDEKPAAFRHLLKFIHDENDSMDVGIIGARTMFHVLSQFGCDELALHMIAKPCYPSFGSWIAEEGANTLFEIITKDPPNGWSHNHHFFGDISAWFIKNLAGIIPNPYHDNPDRILVSPAFVESLSFAEGSYNAPHGKLSVSWKRDGRKIILTADAESGICGEIKLRKGYSFEDGGITAELNAGKNIFNVVKTM